MVIGNALGDGYGPPPKEGSWKDYFLKEINGTYDPKRIHFVGKMDYSRYLNILQSSWVHVYLTIPFVLSWSMLEAMSCGCCVVGSSTAPVREVIQHQVNGILTDFFDPEALAQTVCALLEDRPLAQKLGDAARATIEKKYSLKTCLPRQIALIELVSKGVLHH